MCQYITNIGVRIGLILGARTHPLPPHTRASQLATIMQEVMILRTLYYTVMMWGLSLLTHTCITQYYTITFYPIWRLVYIGTYCGKPCVMRLKILWAPAIILGVPTLQKLNGCFDLAVVILVAVLSDTKEYKSLPSLVILRKIN